MSTTNMKMPTMDIVGDIELGNETGKITFKKSPMQIVMSVIGMIVLIVIIAWAFSWSSSPQNSSGNASVNNEGYEDRTIGGGNVAGNVMNKAGDAVDRAKSWFQNAGRYMKVNAAKRRRHERRNCNY